MTIMVAISEAAKASADALVASGRFSTVEQAIEARGCYGLESLGESSADG